MKLGSLTFAVCAVLALAPVPFARADAESVSKSIMMFCSTVELQGSFINYSEKTVDTDTFEHCANAFQISSGEALTAAHVVKSPEELLAGYFEPKVKVLNLHGFVPGFDPKTIHTIVVTQRLIAEDGTEFIGVSRTWNLSWDGKLEVASIATLLRSFSLHSTTPYEGENRMMVEAIDTQRDLAYLTISPEHQLTKYPRLSNSNLYVGMDTFNVSAVSEQFNNGHLSTIVFNGIISDVNGTSPEQGVTARTVLIATEGPTKAGYSGGFTVTTDGALVGVTHSTTALESQWDFDVPIPCNDRVPCERRVISQRDVMQFLREYRE